MKKKKSVKAKGGIVSKKQVEFDNAQKTTKNYQVTLQNYPIVIMRLLETICKNQFTQIKLLKEIKEEK